MPRAGNLLRVPQLVRRGLELGLSAQPGPDPHLCCLPHHPGRNRSPDAPVPGVCARCPQPGLRGKLASTSSGRSCTCRATLALHLDTRRPGGLAATALHAHAVASPHGRGAGRDPQLGGQVSGPRNWCGHHLNRRQDGDDTCAHTFHRILSRCASLEGVSQPTASPVASCPAPISPRRGLARGCELHRMNTTAGSGRGSSPGVLTHVNRWLMGATVSSGEQTGHLCHFASARNPPRAPQHLRKPTTLQLT